MTIPKKRGIRILVTAAVILLVLAAALALPIAMDPYDCRIAEGVTIGGLDVGGMTQKEAKQALTNANASLLQSQVLTVELPEEVLSFSPETVNPRLQIRRAVWDAYLCGRLDHPIASFGLSSYLSYEENQIRDQLNAYAARYDTTLTQPSWELEGAAPALGTEDFSPDAPVQTLHITLGIPELHLNVDAILANVAAVYDNAFTASYTLTPAVEPEALPDTPDLERIAEEFQVEAVNDALDLNSFLFVHGSYGYGFDQEKAQSLVDSGDHGETLSLPMEYLRPEILGDEVYFRDVLGTCETKHNTNENRNENLRLVCQILDGYILQPGEEFSFNGAVGERTKERGFKPAPAYSGNRLIQDYGGGVCQSSTTLYNCLLLADMEILERHCHGALVGYVPRGLDAAVNWNTKTDLRFVNNSHFPVMIQGEVSDGYIKMKLLGTDEKDYYIKMESGSSETEKVVYANSYKVKYDKETDEKISRDLEARSTYYKGI